MPYRDYTALDFDVPEPGILRIQFNNPKSLNSVSADQHSELARIWADIDRDPEVKVVIVTGAGDAFSSGGRPCPPPRPRKKSSTGTPASAWPPATTAS